MGSLKSRFEIKIKKYFHKSFHSKNLKNFSTKKRIHKNQFLKYKAKKFNYHIKLQKRNALDDLYLFFNITILKQ